MKKALTITVLALLMAVPFVAAQEHENADVDTVVLASTANYPDAYVASAAAAKAGTPILLTDSNQLPQGTSQALQSMDPTEVVIVGGESVVSSDVVSELESMGYEVTRLWGVTRYGTAIKVSDYFWLAGAEEAVLIENDRDDRRGNVLSLGKEVAQERESPVFLTPSGKIPADVLLQLNDLGVEEVTVIGTDLSDAARQQLSDINVSIREEIAAGSENQVEDRLRQRIAERLNQSTTLNVVAAANFRHAIAAVNDVRANSFVVGNEDEIAGAVDAINDRSIQRVRVVGQPGLAEEIVERLSDETNATIHRANFRAEEAAEFASNISAEERQQWAKMRNKFQQESRERLQEREEFIERRANNSIRRAEDRLGENASEEARNALVQARNAFENGEYEEAMRFAFRAHSQAREDKWEEVSRNRTRLRERIDSETDDLQDKVDDLTELNREFGEEMSENMTVEERLEVIREFQDERREHVKELIEKARELRGGGDWEKRIRKARGELRDFESEIEIECGNLEVGTVQDFRIKSHDGEVETEGVVGLSDPGYRGKIDYTADVNGSSVQFDVVYTKRSGGSFIQCTAESEFEAKLDVPSGDWNVTTTVTVDGETVDEMSATVTVAEEEHEDEDEVRRKFRDRFDERRQEMREELREKREEFREDVREEKRNGSCSEAVAAAQDYASGRMCTEQFQKLECPDADVTYGAANGCEISYLTERGWEPADIEDNETMEEDENKSDGNETSTTLPTSLTLETTDGSGCDTSSFYYNGSAVDEVDVPAGEEVTVTFAPRADCTYSEGAQFYSDPDSVFGSSDVVQGGETTQVSFTAEEDFEIEQYWPDESVFKAAVKVDVES